MKPKWYISFEPANQGKRRIYRRETKTFLTEAEAKAFARTISNAPCALEYVEIDIPKNINFSLPHQIGLAKAPVDEAFAPEIVEHAAEDHGS